MVLKKLNIVKTFKFRSRRERIIVIAAVVSAVVFCTVKFGVDPFIESQRRIKDQIPVKLKQLEKYRQFVAGKAEAKKNLAHVQHEAKRNANKLLAGNTPPLAAANLQEILDTLSEKNKIKINSEKVLDSKSVGYFERIPVQVDFTSSITNLTNFIYDIETYQKALSIIDLNIRVTNRRAPRDVRATVVVAGLMQGEKRAGD
jgi:hypothetical protein